MPASQPRIGCLISCPMSYGGQGWPETCVNIVRQFPRRGLQPTLVVPRLRRALPPALNAMQALPPILSALPWRLVSSHARAAHERLFARLLDEADPRCTIAYFWPGSSAELVKKARRAGIVTVREMINTFQGMARRILEQAHDRHGLPPFAGITRQAVEEEARELQLYDHVFASNPQVEQSLREAGIQSSRIIPARFGWPRERFSAGNGPAGRPDGPLRVLFVGTIGVRKGILDLLKAWETIGIEAELLLVGGLDPAVQPHLARALRNPSVKHLPFTDDIAGIYRTSDIFVFPTLEEGGPQVTLEAGGCGLPVITTPMGAARLVEDGVNGMVVGAGDVEALAGALAGLAADPQLRQRFSKRIEEDAAAFAYDRVGAERADILIELLEKERSGSRLPDGEVA